MRTPRDIKKIEATRSASERTTRQLILETESRREYFRFADKELVEYDLTRNNGYQVRLSALERDAIDSFPAIRG